MPHAASGRLQRQMTDTELLEEIGFNAARGKWSVATTTTLLLLVKIIGFNAARGKWSVATQHHVGSPMILDLTDTIWREMQNFSIFSILEHIHESEIQQKSTAKVS